RDRRERAADLLGDQHELEVAEARAAEALGDRGAEPTHLRDALPQRAVVGLVGLEHRATHRERRVLVEGVAGGLLDELVVLGEVEIHARGSFDRSVNRATYYTPAARQPVGGVSARLPARRGAGVPGSARRGAERAARGGRRPRRGAPAARLLPR